MIGAKWTIYWNEYSADTYLFGSEITYYKKDDVEFVNTLMPPGTVIKQWHSKTNYQAHRIEPTLPIIDGESTYRLSVEIDTPEDEQCLIRIVFYDRYEVEAGSITLRDKVINFRCPLKTYSYRIQLINAGVTKLNFHSMTIQEISNETEEKVETIK